MMRKARLAMRKVNLEEDGPGCYWLLLAALFAVSAFLLAKEDQVNENA